MEIKYESKDKSVKISLTYKTSHPQKYYRGLGKAWPRVTQAILNYCDVLYIASVVKHDKDVDNLSYAIRACSKKVLTNIHDKNTRTILWKQILNQTS